MTNAELAILSLLAEQPRHGYQIDQVIEERGMRAWTEVGFSSIYYLLNKLEQEDLIEGHTETVEGRGPARKVYRLTTAGSKAWRAATLEALSNPQPWRTPFMLGLANLPGISTEEALAGLHNYREQLAEQRDLLRARWARDANRDQLQVSALFDLSVTMMEAELDWVKKFIRQLENTTTDTR